jgi:hypothetical protein
MIPCRRPPRPTLAVLATLLLIPGLVGTAPAKTDPVVACAALKWKTVGATTSALLACHAAAAQKGLAADPECLALPPAKLAATFAKGEAAAQKAGGTCPFEGNAATTQSKIDTFVGSILAALRPETGASKCIAKKVASVGKHTQKLFGAHAKNLLKTDTLKLVDAATKAETGLAAVFAKLDDKGKDCQTSGDGPGMVAAAAGLIGTEVCDDADRCTTDTVITGSPCQHAAVTCPTNQACDFRTGSCAVTDCCLMNLGTTFCVVEIPGAQIPTSQAFCQSSDAAHPTVMLISFGSQCIGWRAAGAADCF